MLSKVYKLFLLLSMFLSIQREVITADVNKFSLSFSDSDGIEDKFDNCLSQENPDQLDTDQDGNGKKAILKFFRGFEREVQPENRVVF